jgi:hypothetical protein
MEINSKSFFFPIEIANKKLKRKQEETQYREVSINEEIPQHKVSKTRESDLQQIGGKID